MNVTSNLIFRSALVVALLHSPTALTQEEYFSEVSIDNAAAAIRRKNVDRALRSHIEGAAAALNYVYDCSSVKSGFLRRFDLVADALVQSSATDWGKLDQRHGLGTVAGTLQSYVRHELKCPLRS